MTQPQIQLTKQAEGTYRLHFDGQATEWTVERNDNELEPGGNRAVSWLLRRDGHVEATYEASSRKACLQHWSDNRSRLPTERPRES